MNIKAVFVGINKYQDEKISELNGATRDATALWALFTDSLSGLSARLLTDQNATYSKVQQAIIGTLETATNEDIIILSFAGHGSPDGSLVMYDTLVSNLAGTTIPMVTIAEAFKKTQAKVVLFILDCCFSGHAPARVLEINARSRNPFVFSDIYGEGRILLSACAADEVAWEQPGTSHGLLTFAVIQALQGEAGRTIQFPDIGGEIIRHARIEGEKIGVTQTPVFLGSIQGGLTFPTLQRGENFIAAFPGMPEQKIEGRFEELESCGIEPDIISEWSKKYPNGLNSLQLKAVNDHGILKGNSLLVVAPTSSGKTMIGELAAIQSVQKSRKAAFLLPYRALVNEKFEQFTELYGPSGIRIVRCSGDSSDGIAPALAGRYDIGFFTYETFLNMALNSQKLLSQLGTIIVDEGQFITDPNRGMTVELIYSLLLRSRQSSINPQLLVLSAVIGNLNGFDRWLNLPTLISHERPVPLVEGVLDRRGTFQYLDSDGTTKQEVFLESNKIVQRKEKASSQDVIVPLVKKLISNSEKIIVFRNMRGPAQGCAKYLSQELNLPPANQVLDELPNHDLTNTSSDLREALKGGTAFHNTNLLRLEREAVEKGFRNPQGGIHALAATTTLAAGINTPASTVILAENEFMGDDGRSFTVAEYKNMAGRAGRLGYNEIGKAIILADTPIERAQLFQKYVMGVPEDINSSFNINDLSTWVLRLLSHLKGVRRSDIPSLLINTFGGYSASLRNPEWIKLIESSIKQLISRMLNSNLANLEGEVLHLTLLGRACATSSLSFDSSLRLVELMGQLNIDTILPKHIIAILQVLSESDAIYTPIMKRGRSESVRLSDFATRYGTNMLSLIQRYVPDEFCVWQRCKRASIIWDWIEGMPVDVIESQYTTNIFQGAISYGDINKITEGVRFHLRSAHQILAALFPDRSDFLIALDELLIRIEYGLPSSALGLLKLPIQLTRGQYIALYKTGHLIVEDVLNLSQEQLQEIIGLSSVEQYRQR
ncbi:DEAD/DEAH box helicase [Emticicia fontis]